MKGCTVSEILSRTAEPELFRRELISLDGDFSFSIEDMTALGKVYCSLYPDSVTHSDSAQVQIGYRIVRVCIVEVLVNELDFEMREDWREVLCSISSIKTLVPEMAARFGQEKTSEVYRNLDRRVREIKEIIDGMQPGVIKERFVGGISVFYNILYLIKKALCSE